MVVADGHRLAVEDEVDGHDLHFVKVRRDLKGSLVPNRSGVECSDTPRVGVKHSTTWVWSVRRHPEWA